MDFAIELMVSAHDPHESVIGETGERSRRRAVIRTGVVSSNPEPRNGYPVDDLDGLVFAKDRQLAWNSEVTRRIAY